MRLTARYRVLASVIALGWAVLPAALGAHSADEKHGYCDEHERIEHSVSPDGGALAATDSPSHTVADGSGESPAHDWCPLAEALAGHVASIGEPPSAGEPCLPAEQPGAFASDRTGPDLSILTVAPKQSPPPLAV